MPRCNRLDNLRAGRIARDGQPTHLTGAPDRLHGLRPVEIDRRMRRRLAIGRT